MKDFLIGVVVGIVLTTTGIYTYLKDKALELTSKEKTEKVVKATQDFGKDVKEAFQEE